MNTTIHISTKNHEMLFLPLPNLLIPLTLFFYFSSLLFLKLFKSSYKNPNSQSLQEPRKTEEIKFQNNEFSENEGGLVNSEKEGDLIAEILLGGEALLFLPSKTIQNNQEDDQESLEEPMEVMTQVVDQIQTCTSTSSENDGDQESSWDSPVLEFEDHHGPKDADQDSDSDSPEMDSNNNNNISSPSRSGKSDGDGDDDGDGEFETADSLLSETSKLTGVSLPEKKPPESFAGESTSKSSCEWRSSLRSSTNNRDSELEDLYSSSSRRSSTGWEFDNTFRKYDEEMVFYDRISAQKLHETESLRAVEVLPRSISKRITSILGGGNKKFGNNSENPYQELENAYIAQICLTWEALNWNYRNFRRRISHSEEDFGCSGLVAQQFQQFQVLVQRFIENEPFEHGRRAEVYARMRMDNPKLLQVPEFKDQEGNRSDKITDPTMVSSSEFLEIIENAIRTFMDFLKADKENNSSRILRFFRPNHRASVDPSLHLTIKKMTEKKKKKLNDLRRSRRCCVSKKKSKKPEEIEILMALIDLKVVSRILRMGEIREEQLHWCEEKVSKVRVWDGKIHRDSSTIFFPSH